MKTSVEIFHARLVRLYIMSSVEMIFEIGFNYCCRNFFGISAMAEENLNIKFSANLLNEITNITENCVVEFSGEWAKTLSFLEPDMDLKIIGELPGETEWNNCVLIRNLSCPEPVETRYLIKKISIVETNREDRPVRFIEFGHDRKIKDCRVLSSQPTRTGTQGSKGLTFPNYWMNHKRHIVDHNSMAFRPLTTITQGVAVINVVGAFLSNTAPGPYKFDHRSDPYVRTHVQICDMSFRNLRLAAIRSSGDDCTDVPSYHLHLQIDQDVISAALPWLCVGDVLQVNTVKPVFAQKQCWNLYHKQKKFGDTKIKIHSIHGKDVTDIHGNISEDIVPDQVRELQAWMRERLTKDSLLGPNHKGTLVNREIWLGGRDLVVKIVSANKFTNSITVVDYSSPEEVEVRIRSSQQNFAEALKYLFTKIDNEDINNLYCLLRNVRFNGNDNSLYCSVEHVTKVPEFCFDVQQFILKCNEAPQSTLENSQKEVAGPSFGFDKIIPTQWKEQLVCDPAVIGETQTGCVDGSSQVEFEFLDDEAYTQADAASQENLFSQASDELSQINPSKLISDSQPPVAKKPRAN